MGNILIAGFGSAVDLDVVTAEAGDIVAGKVIVDKNGNPLTGTLSLSGNTETGDVRKGKTFYSTNPKSKQTGTMAEKGAATYTPGTANQVIAANQFLTGAQTILGDADLVAANIRSGKNIFGVAGNLTPYYYTDMLRVTPTGSMHMLFNGDGTFGRTVYYYRGTLPSNVTLLVGIAFNDSVTESGSQIRYKRNDYNFVYQKYTSAQVNGSRLYPVNISSYRYQSGTSYQIPLGGDNGTYYLTLFGQYNS